MRKIEAEFRHEQWALLHPSLQGWGISRQAAVAKYPGNVPDVAIVEHAAKAVPKGFKLWRVSELHDDAPAQDIWRRETNGTCRFLSAGQVEAANDAAALAAPRPC